MTVNYKGSSRVPERDPSRQVTVPYVKSLSVSTTLLDQTIKGGPPNFNRRHVTLPQLSWKLFLAPLELGTGPSVSVVVFCYRLSPPFPHSTPVTPRTRRDRGPQKKFGKREVGKKRTSGRREVWVG